MSALNSHIYAFGAFHLDADKRLLMNGDGENLPLTPKVFDTLLFLVEHAGEVVEKDDLLSAVWPDTIVEENNLSQNISTLRRALGEKRSEHRYIVTIPGRGYKFVSPVHAIHINDAGEGIDEEPKALRISHGQHHIEEQRGNSWDPDGSTDNGIGEAIRPDKTKPRPFKAATALIILILGSLGIYTWRTNLQPAEGTIKKIAVLPFRPLVSGQSDEYIELGIADTLISKLSASGEVAVVPWSSVRKFSNADADALSIGQGLGADAVLEGNIQVLEGRIRVSARLISTKDGHQIWSEQFNDEFADIFAVQGRIAERVAAAVQPQLTTEARRRLAKDGTHDPEAYRLYMLGRYHVAKVILPETRRAIDYFEQAIREDPQYALAYTGLAQAYRTQALSGDLPSREVMPQSKLAVSKALEIDETSASSHVMAGNVSLLYDWDWQKAEFEAKLGLGLEPNNAEATYLLSFLYSCLGRHEEAIAYAKKARQQDPLSLISNSAEAGTLYAAGRYEEAVQSANKTLELDGNFWHPHLMLALAYLEMGMLRQAVSKADLAVQNSSGHSFALAVKGYGLARSGDVSQAKEILDLLLKRFSESYVPDTHLALLYVGLGDKEKALERLENGFEARSVHMVYLKTDPKWNDLRSEPRFIDIMRKMNFQ